MSDMTAPRRSGVLVLAAVLGCVAFPPVAQGQDAGQLRRRIALLEATHREAMAAAARSESLRAEPHDSIRVGRLTVFARAIDDVVQQATAAAWRTLDSIYGDAASGLAEYPLTLTSQERINQVEFFRPLPGGQQRIIVDSTAEVRDITWQLVNAGALSIQAQADSALKNWLGGAPLAEQTGLLSPRARAYEEMVLAPWRSVRSCYLGDLTWCRVALGLAQDSDPVRHWFDAAERRDVVSDLINYDHVRRQRLATDRCLTLRSDEACVAILRSLPSTIPLPLPLPYATRLTLVRRAIDLGGRDAYSRVARGEGSIEERLASAAGVGADSLIAGWRRDILAAPPKTVTFTAAAGWSAVGWVTLLALLGLRSTRWR
jgi:hypothetical protein